MARDTSEMALPGHALHRGLRRRGKLQEAFEAAERFTQSAPNDRRGWARLAHVGFLVNQLPAVDRALARLVELALLGAKKRDAVRLVLRRASLLANTGGQPEPLARQALALATESADKVGAFLSRQVLAVLAVQAGRPTEAGEALTELLRSSLEANREMDALTAVSRLAVGSGPGAGAAAKLLGQRAAAHAEHDIALRWFEEARRRLPTDVDLEREVEKLSLSTNNFKELAAVYTARVARESGTGKVHPLQQLAELRESELSDPQGALEAYETALALDPDLGTLREVFRLSALLGTLGYEVERWKRIAPGRMEEGAEALDRVAHFDLPPSARVRIFETLATVSRDDLGQAERAEDALSRAESLRLLSRKDLMDKGRLEAFSDGVMAIIITVMVLELHVPRGADWAALSEMRASFASYLLSFVYAGIYWNNHHHMLHATRRINGSVMWANLHLLFWLSLVPFATAWMGENPTSSFPAAVYGGVLFLAGFAYDLMERAIVAYDKDSKLSVAVKDKRKEFLSTGAYLLAIGLAFVRPWISQVLYACVAALWVIPDRRIERQLESEAG